MSATAICTLSSHSTRAGAANVADIACSPDLAAHHAAHLTHAISMRSKAAFYTATIPIWNQATENRELLDFTMALPHEDVAICFAVTPDEFKIEKQNENDPQHMG